MKKAQSKAAAKTVRKSVAKRPGAMANAANAKANSPVKQKLTDEEQKLERQKLPPVFGGILADEMGMGKTLQMIALFLANPLPGPTLVVCPAAALLQWSNEMKRCVTR